MTTEYQEEEAGTSCKQWLLLKGFAWMLQSLQFCQNTIALSKQDPEEQPFIGKTEHLFLVVYGHYNIMLRAKLTNMHNTTNSCG